MKNLKPWLYLCALFVLISAGIYQVGQKYLIGDHEEAEEEEGELSGAGKQLNSWWWSRAFPEAQHINEKYMAAWHKAQEIKRNTPVSKKNDFISGISGNADISSSGWMPLGPSTLGGRILCIAIHPVNRKVIFAGSASGGIWKTTTGGVGLNAWQKVVTNLPTLGVTSILIDPSDPNIMYAATGEIYRTDKAAIGFNVWKTRGTYSIGILKSTDGGDNWTQVFTKKMADMFGVQKLRFDPNNSSIIYAACTDGVYRSGNSGATWSRILDKVYVSDVLVNPSNNNQIIAAVGNLTNTDKGIYRTTNGNNAVPTWNKISSSLPASFQGFISFDHHKASNTVFASIGVSSSATTELNRFWCQLEWYFQFGAWTISILVCTCGSSGP